MALHTSTAYCQPVSKEDDALIAACIGIKELRSVDGLIRHERISGDLALTWND